MVAISSSVDKPGSFVTFYSYKGGTGRSMLLANMAWLLAANGKKVLVMDWDLEAPGLHRYFKPFLVDSDMVETDGLIDAFWALTTRGMSADRTRVGNALDYEGFSADSVDLEDFITPIDWSFSGAGRIDLIAAGRQGTSYSERVNTFDWKHFYQIGGGRLLERAKESLANQYHFVLIDSRTGVSDTSGICTMQMPDILVACLTLNRQSIQGVAAILASIQAWRSAAAQNRQASTVQHAELRMFPVATRIENSEKDKLEAARKLARETLKPFLDPSDAEDPRKYWDDMEVTYQPFYAYEEILATFGDPADAAGSEKTLLSQMEKIARRVSAMPNLSMPQIPETDRQRIVDEYSLGAKNARGADMQTREDPRDSDVEFERDIYAKEVLWRNNGFRHEHLLSQREMQLITQSEREKFNRQMFFYFTNSQLAPKLRERALVIFLLIWAAILILATIPVWYPFAFPPSGEQVIYATGYAVVPARYLMIMFIGAAAILSAFIVGIYRSPEKPYGTSLAIVLHLCFLGPFAPEIRDYRFIEQATSRA